MDNGKKKLSSCQLGHFNAEHEKIKYWLKEWAREGEIEWEHNSADLVCIERATYY